jgi:hypothetical protein
MFDSFQMKYHVILLLFKICFSLSEAYTELGQRLYKI